MGPMLIFLRIPEASASLSFMVDLPLLIPYMIIENGYLKASF